MRRERHVAELKTITQCLTAPVRRTLNIHDMHEANAATSLVTPSSTALLWQSWTGMTHLGTVGGSQSYAQAVNSIGKVVGYGKMASAARDAFVWRRN